jgi:hypothetical protein
MRRKLGAEAPTLKIFATVAGQTNRGMQTSTNRHGAQLDRELGGLFQESSSLMTIPLNQTRHCKPS